MPTWISVSDAARHANRSAQWIRDQIRLERLPARQRRAGSQIRLFVSQEDVERLVADLAPKAWSHDGELEPFMPSSLDTPMLSDVTGDSDPLTADSVLLAGLSQDKADLIELVHRLTAEVRRLQAENDNLLETLRITLQKMVTP